MATYDEIESILNKYGPEPPPLPKKQSAPSAPSAPSAGPPAAEAAPASPTGEPEQGNSGIYADPHARWSRGVTKGVTRFGINAGRLIGNLAPSIGDVAQRGFEKLPESVQRKGSELRQFTDEPSEDWAQWLGSGLGELGASALVPGAGATKAAGAVSRLLPATFTKAGGFAPSATARAITGTGRAVDKVAQGATAGAISNPDDPTTGAMAGAAGGAIPGVLGPTLSSTAGKWIGGHGGASALSTAAFLALQSAGFPAWAAHTAAHSVRWYSSPIGRKLIVSGRWITDHTGRVIGEIPAGAMGAATSQTLQ